MAAGTAMQVDGPKTSSSGLEFKLHPLVLINMSDHYTRTRANKPATSAGTKVIGILLGSQQGRTVDVSNSFEIKYDLTPQGALNIDSAFLLKKQEQYKQVFSKLDVVGWYATGQELGPQEMEVNKTIMGINESPVMLLFNPVVDLSQKDLPVALYETELIIVDGVASNIFVKASYTVETSDAERIGVDQVAKLSASGQASGSEQLSSHLGGLHSGTKMLLQRVDLIAQLLAQMRAGTVPRHEGLLRSVASLVSSLPALDSGRFKSEYLTESNDALLAVTLAAMTKGVSTMSDTMDKVLVAYDRSSIRGGGRRGPFMQTWAPGPPAQHLQQMMSKLGCPHAWFE